MSVPWAITTLSSNSSCEARTPNVRAISLSTHPNSLPLPFNFAVNSYQWLRLYYYQAEIIACIYKTIIVINVCVPVLWNPFLSTYTCLCSTYTCSYSSLYTSITLSICLAAWHLAVSSDLQYPSVYMHSAQVVTLDHSSLLGRLSNVCHMCIKQPDLLSDNSYIPPCILGMRAHSSSQG